MSDNPVLNIYSKLTLFDQKILNGIIKQVNETDSDTKAYTIKLIDFELDHLNPSDITQRLKGLTRKTVSIQLEGEDVRVSLLTHIHYEDHDKTVSLTFNSILKPFFLELQDSVGA